MRFREELRGVLCVALLALGCSMSSSGHAQLAVCGTTAALPTTGTLRALLLWIADPGANPAVADSLTPSLIW